MQKPRRWTAHSQQPTGGLEHQSWAFVGTSNAPVVGVELDARPATPAVAFIDYDNRIEGSNPAQFKAIR